VQEDKVNEFMNRVKERKQMYCNVFEEGEGKKILEELSNLAYIKKTTLDDNPQKMAFKEGQRSMVLHIQSMMAIDIDKTQKMAEQQAKQKESDNV
jgi:phenylacetate-coenzyme A ligase PaaK-like adenylate-forming protein